MTTKKRYPGYNFGIAFLLFKVAFTKRSMQDMRIERNDRRRKVREQSCFNDKVNCICLSCISKQLLQKLRKRQIFSRQNDTSPINVKAAATKIQIIRDNSKDFLYVWEKKQFLVRQNKESRRTCHHDGFQAFCLRRHSDFLLHCVDK